MKFQIFGSLALTLVLLCCFSCNNDDPAPAGPTDFFTVQVDQTFPTAEDDNWVLASSNSGEWITWQEFESGETVTLKGTVPNDGLFTIHFLSIPKSSTGQKQIKAHTYTSVTPGSRWLVKGGSSVPGTYPKLTVNVTNYTPSASRTFPNQPLTVSSSTGTGGLSGSFTGSNYSYNVDIGKSPSDVLVTLYKSDGPYYVRYDNLAVPTTVNIDAATQGKIADKTFTMNLPENVYHFVYLQAFNKDNLPFEMSGIYSEKGGSQEKLGYDNGYSSYRTQVQSSMPGKSRYFSAVGKSIVEQPSFPDFDIIARLKTLNDFRAVSSLSFDYVVTRFAQTTAELAYLHLVVQPKTQNSTIDFQFQQFPQELTNKYPFLPSPNQVNALAVTGVQREELTYEKVLEEFAASALFGPGPLDNVYMFTQQVN
ncbi:hypothetical protein WBG78_27645 [Chryseolinea sp. T2]|uniref:hypothetical protein n=1 Tax=Chryseolinea sp. T2 TaxID=3129255 RepID=UPI00307846EE